MTGRLVVLLLVATLGQARAQIPLYAQRLPDSTVYLRFANALPGPAQVQTAFAGPVALGTDDAGRISPYFVDTSVQAGAVTLRLASAGHRATVGLSVQPGSFTTVLLQPGGASITAVPVLDHPDYNQLRARLAFYNATPDCPGGTLTEASGRAIFTAVPSAGVQARSVAPAAATLTAGCGAGSAPPLSLGTLEAGSLTSVWLMRPAGSLLAFAAHDTIAPPQ